MVRTTCIFVLAVCAFAETIPVQFGAVKDGDPQKGGYTVEILNVGSKPIRAINVCRATTVGLRACTLGIFGLKGKSSPIGAGQTQRFPLGGTLEEKGAPTIGDLKVDLIFFTDGTTIGPDSQKKAQYVEGAIAASMLQSRH